MESKHYDNRVHNFTETANSDDSPPEYEPENRPGQKLERYITLIPSIAFNAVLQASWSAVAVSFQAGLLNGGPTSLVWGMLLSWVGTTAVAASLAEMASMNPSVGAQYRWSALYAPRGLFSPAFWSFLQGWITVVAWIATFPQVAFLEGGIVEGIAIQLNPTWIPKQWHGTLIAWAVIVLPLLCNIFARKILVQLELAGGVANILFFFIIVIVLGAMAPRSPASFVFATTFTGFSGWKSAGIQWCIGLLSAAFPLFVNLWAKGQGFDGVIHMSAEIKDPSRRVPWAMVLAVVLNGLFAFCFIIALLFTITDVTKAAASPTFYPIIEVFYLATKSQAATAVLMAMIIYLGMMALFSTLTSTSRLTWAFANDNGLPFSRFFSRIHPTLHIPLNALLLVTVIAVLLLLINIGSTTAFFAIVSLSTFSLYISYIIPLVFFTAHKLRGEHIPYGPFKMQKTFGLAVNFLAICWAIFIAIFLPFPAFQPVTAQNMNWAGPVMGAVIVWAIFDYITTGRRRWKAPIDRKDLEEKEKEEGGN